MFSLSLAALAAMLPLVDKATDGACRRTDAGGGGGATVLGSKLLLPCSPRGTSVLSTVDVLVVGVTSSSLAHWQSQPDTGQTS